MTKTISITHNGSTYDGQLATIKSTTFGTTNAPVLTAWLHCEWPGAGIGVGGYSLDGKPATGSNDRLPTAQGLDHLVQMMDTVGVESWEDLPGKQVIVLFDAGQGGWGGQAVGIANTLDDRVLIFKERFESFKQLA